MRLTVEGSLRADAFALQALKQHEGGKLIQWAWVSRGLVSMEQVANWHHGGDLDAAKEAMSYVRGSMKHLYQLDEIPAVDPEPEHQEQIVAAESCTLEGETHQFWAISDPDIQESDPIPLPEWFQLPIDTTLLTWKREKEIWEERKSKREAQGFDSLAPKMQAAYNEWMSNPTRVLVLDKKKKAQVLRPGKKSQNQLKKTCLMLMLHPSLEASNLWIRSGTGKQWSLRLLEGQSIPNVAVPDEVDHFSGL